MNAKPIPAPIFSSSAEALVYGRFQDEPLSESLTQLDAALDGAIGQMGDKELPGKKHAVTVLTPLGRISAKRIAIVGLGKQADLDPRTLTHAATVAVRELKDKGIAEVAIDLPGDPRLIVEGAYMALFEPDAYHKERKTTTISTLCFANANESEVEKGRIVGEAINFCRTLVNEPANSLTPTALADQAQQAAERSGLSLTVLDEDDMHRLGMCCLLAVGRGSEKRAKLIVMSHRPNPDQPYKLALVGKGVTFDTGGISIKPTEGMGAMKGDMAGAAATIAAMEAIGRLNLPINVLGVAPAVENMPDGAAYRPGDVIKAMNGKTVEIITTDAEGRLALADALTFAARQGAERIVDLATLTGAVGIALGPYATGAMTNNPELLELVRSAGESVGERIWELPAWDDYSQLIKSPIADLKNASANRRAGAIAGGVFLKEFVEDRPWVHLDIASTATVGEHQPGMAQGPSGVPVRALVRLAESLV
ncbi:MAG: leucyl aminopeptidase [Armatimonadetes bacterium]|nr:leucyl aminopeptidase [Armatimonadota bacterium]